MGQIGRGGGEGGGGGGGPAGPWAKVKQQIAYAFYWHGLQCASSPFQVITTATLAAMLMTLPAIPSLREAWPAWRAEVWHEPVADPAHPGALHIDDVPEWATASGTQTPILDILQFHVTVPKRGNAVALETLQLAASDLPTFLREELRESDSLAYQQWQQACVRDAATGSCAILHPHLPPELAASASSDGHDSWPGLDLAPASSSMMLRLGETRLPFSPAPDVVGKSCKRRHSFLHCDALVVSLITSNTTTAEQLQPRLERAVQDRFSNVISSTDARRGVHTRLFYERRILSTMERGLLVVSYVVLLFYMINSVTKVEAVMSRAGLALAAVSIMTASVISAVGVCSFFGLVRNFRAFEVIPFLVMVIGLDNITTITTAVVGAPPTVAVRFRIAHGLSRAGPQLTVSLFQMEAILMLGAFSHIPQLKDFSIVACAAMLCNFSFQVIIYVAVMSLDMRRLELSDLMRQLDQADSHAQPISILNTGSHDFRSIQNLLRGASSRGVVINAVLVVMSMAATVLIAVLSGQSGPHTLGGYAEPNTDATWLSLALAGVGDASQHSAVLVFRPVVELPFAGTTPVSPALRDYIGTALLGMDGMFDVTQVVLAALGVMVLVFWVRAIVKSTQHALFGQREDVDSLAAMSLIDVEIGTLYHHAQLELFSVNSRQQLVAACSMDGSVSVWDLQTHRHLCSLRDEKDTDGNEEENDKGGCGGSAVVRGDVPWCMATYAHFVALGFNNGIIELWELHTQYCHILQPPGGSAQGRKPPRVTQLTFASNHLVAARDDGVLEAWAVTFDCDTGTPSAAATPTNITTRSSPPSALTAVPPLQLRRGVRHHRRDASGASDHDMSGLLETPPHRVAGHRRTLSAESVASQASQGTFRYESFNTLKDLAAPTPATIEHICTRKCHTSTITCMTLFGDFIVTAGRDACIRVVRKLDFGVSSTLTGHTGPVSCLTTFSGPTRTSPRDPSPLSATIIVSGSADGSVRVWDLSSAQGEAVFHGHEDMVTHVAANSIHVVSLSDDDTLRMWDRRAQTCIRVLQPQKALHSLVLHPSSILVTVSNAELTAWDVMASGERIRTISLNIDPSTATADQPPALHDSHMVELVHNDTVLCSFGAQLYVVRLPFPTLRKHKEQ